MRRLVRRRRSESIFVAARDSSEAFGELYDRYAGQIVGYLVRQTLDPEVAFDLTAETFADALHDIGAFRGRTDEEGRAWLFAIATHQLYRWRKRRALECRRLAAYGIPARDLSADEFERIEELADLQRFKPFLDRALRTLSEDQRDVLQLRVVEVWSYDEIAAFFDSTNYAVRHRVSRALRQLAVTLERLGALYEGDSVPAREELMT